MSVEPAWRRARTPSTCGARRERAAAADVGEDVAASRCRRPARRRRARRARARASRCARARPRGALHAGVERRSGRRRGPRAGAARRAARVGGAPAGAGRRRARGAPRPRRASAATAVPAARARSAVARADDGRAARAAGRGQQRRQHARLSAGVETVRAWCRTAPPPPRRRRAARRGTSTQVQIRLEDLVLRPARARARARRASAATSGRASGRRRAAAARVEQRGELHRDRARAARGPPRSAWTSAAASARGSTPACRTKRRSSAATTAPRSAGETSASATQASRRRAAIDAAGVEHDAVPIEEPHVRRPVRGAHGLEGWTRRGRVAQQPERGARASRRRSASARLPSRHGATSTGAFGDLAEERRARRAPRPASAAARSVPAWFRRMVYSTMKRPFGTKS